MGRFVDSVITYRILKLLVTPFDKTKAFQLGIIDSKGKELKKMRQLNTVAERDAYSLLHRLVYRLKKIIEKVPLQNKKLLSYAAALSLIREHMDYQHEPIELENLYLDKIGTNLTEEIQTIEGYFLNKPLTFKEYLEEDIPANNAGGGGIAGLDAETMGVSKKAANKYKKQNQTMARRANVTHVG
jgi:hypothetical protein|tara:strand:- start:11639 stop:12193 length:555 start_codon:yes stop_codon:yes gene_type:complete